MLLRDATITSVTASSKWGGKDKEEQHKRIASIYKKVYFLQIKGYQKLISGYCRCWFSYRLTVMYKTHLEEGHSPTCTATCGAALTDHSAGLQTKRHQKGICNQLKSNQRVSAQHTEPVPVFISEGYHLGMNVPSYILKKTLSQRQYNQQRQKIVRHLGKTQNIKERGNEAQLQHAAKMEGPMCRSSFQLNAGS